MIARTSYGEMFDFLKAFPSVTMEQYMWQMTIAQIGIAKNDSTHIVYLPDNEDAKFHKKKKINVTSISQLANDFGIPVIKAE